ncbi:hypothetical protein [Kineosporia sp. R_H_3]|uniref:hypothetical protein n=1 Tax=Kineosporia sp. R_H_3 TaxID=1961848 RepID=UPI0018E96268|nr:hypothetical protein [Kineosporia sp. R_H_3]
MFTVAHEAFWTRARAAHGDAEATRALIEVLLLHRHLPATAITAGIRAALAAGSTSPELVTVEARRATTARPIGRSTRHRADAVVLALPTTAPDPTTATAEDAAEDIDAVVRRRLAGLPGERPLPSVAHYDQLLSDGLTGGLNGGLTEGTPDPDPVVG